MNIKVIKRDGRKVDFNSMKIISAVKCACEDKSTGDSIGPKVAQTIKETLETEGREEVDIEHIQDLVEKAIIMLQYPDVAKKYIIYRNERSKVRTGKSKLNRKIEELICTDAEESDTKRENANVDGNTTCGSLLQIAGAVTKDYYFDHVSDGKFRLYHENGIIHLHDADLSLFTINCLYIPLAKLLKNGFSTGHVYLSTPSNVISAAELTCVIIQSNQNDMFGGQAIANLDYDLAPYVAKSFVRNCAEYIGTTEFGNSKFSYDNLKENFIKPLDAYIIKHGNILNKEGYDEITKVMDIYGKLYNLDTFSVDNITQYFNRMSQYAMQKTDRDTYQGMQALVFNLNSLNSRSGAQTPFSSVNLGLDTSDEGRMVTKNLFEIVKKGTSSGETFIFPISIFKIHKDVSYPGCKNYDLFKLACETSALRLYPNFVNVSAPMNIKYYDPSRPETSVASMGCVRGSEVALWKIGNTRVRFNTFEEMGSYLSDKCTLIKHNDNSFYIDMEKETLDLRIWDSHHAFVKVKKFIVNRNVTNWRLIRFSNGNHVVVTGDHPLPVVGKGRTIVDDIYVGDKIPVTNKYPNTKTMGRMAQYFSARFSNFEPVEVLSIDPIEQSGYSYDVETESDRFDFSGIQSHNCRTRVLGNKFDKSKSVTSGRGNLFFNTINLPYLALLAKEKYPTDEVSRYNYFNSLLDVKVHELLEFSHDRFEMAAKRKAKNFPFLMGQHVYKGSDNLLPDEEIREVIKHGSMAVGFIGLAEALVALFGKHHGESKESQAKGLEIIGRMKAITDDYSEREQLNYSIIATPAEGCSGRLLRATRKRFGIVPGVTDREYFTNSSHVPVYYKISAYDKIQIEAPYHPLCEGGIIGYIELDYDATKNIEAFEALVMAMADSGMTYFSINHPVDHDPICGYTGYIPEGGCCPRCGRKNGEGVPAFKLLSLRSYNPTPEYAVRYADIEADDVMTNMVDIK